MKIRVLSLSLLLLLSLMACSSGNADSTPAPTQEVLLGNVDIEFPVSGSIIYSESVTISGTSANTTEDGFQIQLVLPDDSVLSQANVLPEEDGTWSVELVHEYADDPTEITIVAKPTSATSLLDYDIESIVLATLDFRPEGVFGAINVPEDGAQVGGDSILVSGRGSGFFENTILLSLVDTEGETVVTTIVTLNNPNFIDDMLWEAELPRQDFIGNATIQISYQDAESGETVIVDEVDVVVSSVAG